MTTDHPIAAAVERMRSEGPESLAAKATPGPWHQGPYYKCDVHSPHQRRDRDFVVRGSSILACDAVDAALIAASRTDAPLLADLIHRLCERLGCTADELEATVKYLIT